MDSEVREVCLSVRLIAFFQEKTAIDLWFCGWFKILTGDVFLLRRERGTEGNTDLDRTRNLSMCPSQELNPQPFGVWDTLQPTELSSQGMSLLFNVTSCHKTCVLFKVP